MRTYVTLFTLSFLVALVLTPFVRRKALAWGAVAHPDKGRHIHPRPTARLGGVAIYLAFLATLLCVPFLGNMVGDIFRANIPKLSALLLPATIIFLFGVYDDFRGASATLKLAFQTIAAVLIYGAGFGIENLSSPFGGVWHLSPVLGFALTWLWIVGITNAFNLIDGIDGLATGASVFALLSILVFSIRQENPEISQLAVVLVGAAIGFLRYNFNPATIFLGDSGSLFLGFMAAVLSLAGSQKGSTIVAIAIPLVSFGLPVTEAGLSLVRRFLSGEKLLAGDRGHIHHMLLRRGLTQRQAAILLYAVCALFSLFGLMLLDPLRELAALTFIVLGVGVILGVQRLRYAEFSALGEQIRQGVTRRRRALAVNVRVRRTRDDLNTVRTLAQLFAVLEDMLQANEFDRATLCVNADLAFALDKHRQFHVHGAAQENIVLWSWRDAANALPPQHNQEPHWSLSVPLTDEQGDAQGTLTFYRALSDDGPTVDLGYLCGPFQRELSAALARLTVAHAKA